MLGIAAMQRRHREHQRPDQLRLPLILPLVWHWVGVRSVFNMRSRVANILVVLLFFFLGQDLHLGGESAERREMSEIRVAVVVVVEV
jgi:hypothetical protein